MELLREGTVFGGDYRVVRPLNQGGMGAVYVAEQLSTGKARALKLMHRDLVYDPQTRQRFEQEARVGSRIASEHIVEVVAAGVDPQTQLPYLVMELLEGEDMASRLRRGPFSIPEAKMVLEQLAHALGAAHDARVVHRDLKPENVFLALSKRMGQSLVVKVLDFGIAKVTEDQRNTTGAYGTPMWLAPEQTRRGEITPAADVWAFGLLVFTMLTGHPFWHVEGPNASLPTLLQEILQVPIPPASSRAAEYAVSLPPGFDMWLARALDREPQRRFPNVRAAWTALAPILSAPAPIELPRASAPQRSSGAPIAMIAAFILLFAGAGVAGAAYFVLARSKPVAVAAPTLSPTPTPTPTPTLSPTPTPTPTPTETEAPSTTGTVNCFIQTKDGDVQDDVVTQYRATMANRFVKCLAGEPSASIIIAMHLAADGSVASVSVPIASPEITKRKCLREAVQETHFARASHASEVQMICTWKK